ncbi:MAG: penicillin-binding protein, partial [Clostridioides sp.]|nr:penicillin-binding protein [Clostridioides sp.]
TKDVWFSGYTPYYSAALYIADDQLKGVTRESISGGSGTAAALWSKIMTKVHKNLEVVDFKVPKKVYFSKINLVDGGRQGSGSRAAFIEGTGPTKISSQPSPSTTTKTDENNNTQNPATPTNPNQPNNNGDSNNTENKPSTGGGTEPPKTPDAGNSGGGQNQPSTDGDGTI